MASKVRNFSEHNLFLRRLWGFGDLTEQEVKGLQALCERPRFVKRGTDLFPNSQEATVILLEGWGRSYRSLPNGKQVIIDFRTPGDIVCLREILLGRSHQFLAAASDAFVCFVPRRQVERLTNQSPGVRNALLAALDLEDMALADRFLSIARRDALGRTAALFVDLWRRLEAVGEAQDYRFVFPIIQDDMADALGLTSVHVNRVLRQLREREILTLSHGCVTIHNYDALKVLAQKDS